MELQDFFKKSDALPKTAIFMSGSGTNAEKLLGSLQRQKIPTWIPAVIISDNPNSRGAEIAKKYSVPFVLHDIKAFYRERGEKSISLASENGRKIREEWTNEMRKIISPFNITFGILAGFVPLTNICKDFPCLNVHPGDLTVEKSGRRLFVGLHCVPIETAILAGFNFLRSSVIVAQPYSGEGGEMDTGPIIGISQAVPVDISETERKELFELAKSRPTRKPIGGYNDKLENIAKFYQEKLKQLGDWTVFPPAVEDFSKGLFKRDIYSNLYYKENGKFVKIKTVEYRPDGERKLIKI